MSETAQQIIKSLQEFFTPKKTGGQWRSNVPRPPEAQVVTDPDGYRLGVRDNLEIRETAEETWLSTYAPELVQQRRLRRTDRFWIAAHYVTPTKIELGNVLTADGQCKYFTQRRALLALREHAGREIWITQVSRPGTVDIVPGYEQRAVIKQHGLAWAELEEPIDTEHRVYPIAIFD
jgi:hypothetical protein